MTPPHRRTCRAVLALTGITTLLVASASTSASAAAPLVEHFVNDSTVVLPDGSTDFCGDLGFDVVETNHEKGTFTAVQRGRNGILYTAATFNGTTTWSNPENGREYRVEYGGADRDQLVTDNGDGTVTILVQQSGPNRYYDNGRLAFIDTGMVRFRIVIDQMGTPADPADDEFVEFLGLDTVTGLRQTDGRDFCADITEFLG